MLPSDCENIENIVDAMKQAHDLYLSVYSASERKPVIAFIVDQDEVNI